MGWGGASPSAGALKATPAGAARLLTQASFGPTDGSISDVQTLGYGGWIASQIAMPVSASHLAWVDAAIAGEGTAKATPTTFYGSFWRRLCENPH